MRRLVLGRLLLLLQAVVVISACMPPPAESPTVKLDVNVASHRSQEIVDHLRAFAKQNRFQFSIRSDLPGEFAFALQRRDVQIVGQNYLSSDRLFVGVYGTRSHASASERTIVAMSAAFKAEMEQMKGVTVKEMAPEAPR